MIVSNASSRRSRPSGISRPRNDAIRVGRTTVTHTTGSRPNTAEPRGPNRPRDGPNGRLVADLGICAYGCVPAGEGKGWAKGRSAKDDPRIARAAAGHRGKSYVPQVPPEQDRRRTSAPVDTTWTHTLAYAIGLMATDGCVADGDHVSFPSADRELVELFAACLGKGNTISETRTRTGGTVFRLQFGDVAFCRWLATIGITGRKSLTIGALDVPDAYLVPLARGLLDGDGSIINKLARADTKRRSDYYWE